MVLEKLGEALIIAVILALFVDEAVKHTLMQEVARDVIDFWIGFTQPPAVKEQIQYILRLPFIRLDFTTRYVMKYVSTGEPHPLIRVESFTSYKVVNLTNSPKVFTFRSSIEKSAAWSGKRNHLKKMEAAAVGFALEGKLLDDKTLETECYLVAEIPITVPEEAAGSVEFKTERVAYYSHEHTIVLDILEPPCIGIKVIVEAPPDFVIFVSFGTYGKVEGDKVRTWYHPGVHLPGSHFRISWEPASKRHSILTVEDRISD
jgi:hypothetical protein